MNSTCVPLSYTHKNIVNLCRMEGKTTGSGENTPGGEVGVRVCPSVFVKCNKPSTVDFVSVCPEEKSMCRILLYNSHLRH